MEFTPYKITETLEYMFYQVPMELLFNANYKNNLSLEAKMLYGFLLSQLTLSIKNNWQDENGDVYIILTREKVQKMLNISDKTATKAFKQLNKCKLIYEKKQGQTKPNLIYVGKIKHDDTIPNMIRKNYDSRVVKNTIHDSENLRPNYNNNYNKRTNKNHVNFEQRDYPEGALDFLYANNWEQLYDN